MAKVLKRYICPLVVAWWYASNIGLVLLNKALLSSYGFHFPVFLTMAHMAACAALSQASASLGLLRVQRVGSRQQMAKIVILSAVFCASVVCGNVSLRFIPVSFNQAIGATTPFFTALLSFLLLGAVESSTTYAALIPVVLGIVIASQFEPSFTLAGFTAGILSAAARALKTVLQGVLLSDKSEQLDSLNLLRLMSPLALVMLLPVVLLTERHALSAVLRLSGEHPVFPALLLLNVVVAYSVNLGNFLVTSYTSPLTTQVLGNMKGAVATAISILLFHNPITIVGMLGYAVTTLGCVLYSEAKKRGALLNSGGRKKKTDALVSSGWGHSCVVSNHAEFRPSKGGHGKEAGRAGRSLEPHEVVIRVIAV